MKKTPVSKGELWVNLGTGDEYQWNGHQWEKTGRQPYGFNPMKVLTERELIAHQSSKASGAGTDDKV